MVQWIPSWSTQNWCPLSFPLQAWGHRGDVNGTQRGPALLAMLKVGHPCPGPARGAWQWRRLGAAALVNGGMEMMDTGLLPAAQRSPLPARSGCAATHGSTVELRCRPGSP